MRFHANDEPLRPMGRATTGVTGMKFRDGDSLLSMTVVRDGEDPDVFVVFENGMAKRSPASDYRQGPGGPRRERWPRSPSAAATWSAR